MYTNEKVEYISPRQAELMRLYSQPVNIYDDDGNIAHGTGTPVGRKILDAIALQRFKEECNTIEHKIMVKKCDMQERIISRVEDMIEPYFFTFTMSDNAMNQDFHRSIKKYFKKLKIENWVLVEDYGEENDRLHYHGYVDLFGVDPKEIEHTYTKKYHNAVKLKHFSKYLGFNLGTKIKMTNKIDLKKTIRYTLKYTTKGTGIEFKHKMFCSRRSKNKVLQDLPF